MISIPCRGAVANMLLTSCMDNISRLWIETILPDDGLLNMQHLDPLASQNPKYRQNRHKHGFVERLKHMRKSFRKARTQRENQQQQTNSSGVTLTVKKEPVPTLPSSNSGHDFHKFGVHGTGVSPECHFHLAVSINADTDIPLVPLLSSGSGEPLSFVIHWLNNKDMNFTWQAEKVGFYSWKIFYWGADSLISLTDCLIDCSIDWSIDYLIIRLIDLQYFDY